MKNLNYQLKELSRRNRDGSYSTQAHRDRILSLCAKQLPKLGYFNLRAKSLKPKHVEALVRHWQDQGLSTGTLKNRLAALRWWAEKVNKAHVMARDNTHYGIESRTFVAKHSKGQSLTEEILERIQDPFVRISLQLQRFFGLRREEAIKFIPSYADRGHHLQLKATWTKGGRARTIPIRTQAQWDVLARAHKLAGAGSLIRQDRRYVDQLHVYERQVSAAGLSKAHGLRHTYAQQRYRELTGWDCPAVGGTPNKDLTPEQQQMDRDARLIISQELGHNREQITAAYLGR